VNNSIIIFDTAWYYMISLGTFHALSLTASDKPFTILWNQNLIYLLNINSAMYTCIYTSLIWYTTSLLIFELMQIYMEHNDPLSSLNGLFFASLSRETINTMFPIGNKSNLHLGIYATPDIFTEFHVDKIPGIRGTYESIVTIHTNGSLKYL